MVAPARIRNPFDFILTLTYPTPVHLQRSMWHSGQDGMITFLSQQWSLSITVYKYTESVLLSRSSSSVYADKVLHLKSRPSRTPRSMNHMEVEEWQIARSCVVLRVLLWASTDHCVRFVKLNMEKQKGGSAPSDHWISHTPRCWEGAGAITVVEHGMCTFQFGPNLTGTLKTLAGTNDTWNKLKRKAASRCFIFRFLID